MKAMILAAGLGTRLKPLTDSMPKALVEVDGVPMLERVILNLKKHGADFIVVNTHHFAGMIKDFLRKKDFGIEIMVSDESEQLLDTGGGIVRAAPLLFNKDSSPVLIHNVDILSNAPVENIMREADEVTTLLVSERDSQRQLIFDERMMLQGWHDRKNDLYKPEGFSPQGNLRELAFSGIYAITEAAVDEMRKLMGEGKYSVMDYFLNPDRLQPVKGLETRDLKVLDIGKPATLAQATDFI